VRPWQGSLYSNLVFSNSPRRTASWRRRLQEGDFRDARSLWRTGLRWRTLSLASGTRSGDDPERGVAINPTSIQVNSTLAESTSHANGRSRPKRAEAIAEAARTRPRSSRSPTIHRHESAKQAAAIPRFPHGDQGDLRAGQGAAGAIDYTEGRAAEAHVNSRRA